MLPYINLNGFALISNGLMRGKLISEKKLNCFMPVKKGQGWQDFAQVIKKTVARKKTAWQKALFTSGKNFIFSILKTH